MRYVEVEGLPPGHFKRLTGVKRETFELMLSVLKQSEEQKKRSGRPSKLSLADQLLLTLMYWREYRTQFHIAKSYCIHEANANRIIRKVEGALAASGEFKLPGKRAAHSNEGVEISFVIVDVTETPIEKPKKSSDSATARSVATFADPVRDGSKPRYTWETSVSTAWLIYGCVPDGLF